MRERKSLFTNTLMKWQGFKTVAVQKLYLQDSASGLPFWVPGDRSGCNWTWRKKGTTRSDAQWEPFQFTGTPGSYGLYILGLRKELLLGGDAIPQKWPWWPVGLCHRFQSFVPWTSVSRNKMHMGGAHSRAQVAMTILLQSHNQRYLLQQRRVLPGLEVRRWVPCKCFF